MSTHSQALCTVGQRGIASHVRHGELAQPPQSSQCGFRTAIFTTDGLEVPVWELTIVIITL